MTRRLCSAMLAMFAAWALTTPVLAQETRLRARDAVDFFGGVCGRVVANWEPAVDHERYRLVWMNQQDATYLGLGDLVVWWVAAPESDLAMLHYVNRDGICGVEVEAADEQAVKSAFGALVPSMAKGLSLEAKLKPSEEDDDPRTQIWRLGQPGNGYDIGLLFFSEADAPLQFMMTMAKLKAEAPP